MHVSWFMTDLHAGPREELDVAGLLARIEGAPPSHGWTILFETITGVDIYRLEGILLNRSDVPTTASARTIVDNLARFLDVRVRDALDLLSTTSSRVSRNDRVDATMLDRAYAVAHTYARVAAVLGTTQARAWFKTPNPALDGDTPIALLGTRYGERRIENLIDALLNGAIV